ncbi:MAG: sel1 repeat family protein, partial [Alphaproteobacteria bacterium]|nr:sel1 repeat family protein [Alphaproteobacteria bacterium]
MLKLFTVLIFTICIAKPAFAGYSEAIEALKKKEYRTAMFSFLPLAKTGDAKAQIMLAYMYDKGLGVAQDDETS